MTVLAFLAAVSIAGGQTESRTFWTDLGPHNGTSAQSIVLEKIGHGIGLSRPASALYLGTSSDGIFKSGDQGTTWVPFDDGLSDYSVTVLAVVQKEIQLGAPEVTYETALYAGTQSGGLFRYESEWTHIGGGLSGSHVLAIAAASVDIVYVATEAGVFKSVDGGTSWHSANTGLPMGQVTALAVDPQSTQTVLAGVGPQVFKSSDGAESWISILSLSDVVVTSIGIAPTIPFAIFVGVTPTGPVLAIPDLPGELFRSTDGGTTWTNLTDPFRSMPIILVSSFAFDSVAPAVYAGTWGIGVLRSTDMGETWASMRTGLTDQFVTATTFDSSAEHPSLYAGTVADGYLSGGPVFRLLMTLGPPSGLPNRSTHSVPFRGAR